MASELLSSVTGGGGGFTAKFASPGVGLAPGLTGTLFTLTPPSGQRVQLTQLVASALTTNLYTLTVGGSAIVTSLPLNIDSANSIINGNYGIGGNSGNQTIVGGVDEVVALTTNVATSHATYYAYQFGV